MLTRPEHGWADVCIGDYRLRISYIEPVPEMLLTAFIRALSTKGRADVTFDAEGWKRRLMTGKGVTISVNGMRNVGDTGNDFVAGLTFKNGRDAEAYFEWTFPDGTKVAFEQAVINVKNIGAGDSTNVGPLEFDVMSNGKPTVTPAA